jgi:hypothetical protein
MLKKKWLPVMMSFLVIGTIGCSSQQEAKKEEEHTGHASQVQGDIREKTATDGTLPTFLATKDENIGKIYQIAAANRDLLEQMPCYCGCGDSVDHKSNLDCFINEQNDKEIIWDSHATTCKNCMEIAVESAKMKQEGKSVLEIRQYIDTKYKEGYAKPTPTPMPKA